MLPSFLSPNLFSISSSGEIAENRKNVFKLMSQHVK